MTAKAWEIDSALLAQHLIGKLAIEQVRVKVHPIRKRYTIEIKGSRVTALVELFGVDEREQRKVRVTQRSAVRIMLRDLLEQLEPDR